LEVAGLGYVIFTVNYDSVINNIYNNYYLCCEFIDKIFGDKYNFVFISKSEWEVYREKYISDLKNGIKYSLKEMEDIVIDTDLGKNIKTDTSLVDKLFELVGEDCVEIK